MPELTDLLREAEPPTAGFSPDDVLRRAAAHQRRARLTTGALAVLVLVSVVAAVLVTRPAPRVQVVTPPPATTAPSPAAGTGTVDAHLGALRDLPEEEVAGVGTGWRVRDGDAVWWLTRGINPDGTLCLVRGTAAGVAGVDASARCGVVPFAITVDGASGPEVAVVVPDGYDRAAHAGATADVVHNVAILPADGSAQPTVAVAGPGVSQQLTANLYRTLQRIPPATAVEGGRDATPAEVEAVAAEVPTADDPPPTAARAVDLGTTTTIALRYGEGGEGSACIGLLVGAVVDARCIPLDQDVRDIADGPLLAAVAAGGTRAYLVEDRWQAMRLPDGRELPVTANTITIPAEAGTAATAILVRDDGEEVLVALHRPPPATGAAPRVLEGHLTAYAGEPMRFCAQSVAPATEPVQCSDRALEVVGLDIADVPHTVQDADRGRFTADPILVEGSVEGRRLTVTSLPPKITLEATSAAAGQDEVALHIDDRQDYPSLGQTVGVVIMVGSSPAGLDEVVRAEGEPSGALELRPPPPCEQVDGDGEVTALCDRVAGFMLLDTGEAAIGSTYVVDVPLLTGGTASIAIGVGPADDLPRPF